MHEFGPMLRSLLRDRGLSQAGFARTLGVTPTAVSYWISGQVKPSPERVIEIEDALELEPPGLLLDAIGYSRTAIDTGPTVESLLRADPGLDPEDKRALLRLLALARARHVEQPGPYPVNFDDPDERRIWDANEFSEGQRWRWILELRAGRAGDADVEAQ